MTGVEFFVPAVLALASFILAFIGFGFSVVAVPLLALVLPVKMAVGVCFPFITVLILYNSWQYGRPVDWKTLRPLLIGCIVAVPLGFLSLNYFPETIMKKSLAVFIALAVISGKLAGRRLSPGQGGPSPWWGGLMGVISGWFNGAYTTGGPPAILYFLTATDNPAKIKGLIGVFYFFNLPLLVVLYIMGGVITNQSLFLSLKYSPAVIIGGLVGIVAFNRAGTKGYRTAADIVLVLAALLLWFRS